MSMPSPCARNHAQEGAHQSLPNSPANRPVNAMTRSPRSIINARNQAGKLTSLGGVSAFLPAMGGGA